MHLYKEKEETCKSFCSDSGFDKTSNYFIKEITYSEKSYNIYLVLVLSSCQIISRT